MTDDELDEHLAEGISGPDTNAVDAPFVSCVMASVSAARRRRRGTLCGAAALGTIAAVVGLGRVTPGLTVGITDTDVVSSLALVVICAVAWMGTDEWAAGPRSPVPLAPWRRR